MSYNYFEKPLGEDVLKKFWISTKVAGGAGFLVSTCDVMLYSFPKGYLQTLGRYLFFTGPFIASAGAFTVAANILASTRKKDDRWNFFLGGVAAGSIIGAWRKSLMVGFLTSMAFGIMAVVKKDSIDEGWMFMPPLNNVQLSGVNTKAFDFTMTKERPRNWTTEENKQ